jgi:arylsulfatase A
MISMKAVRRASSLVFLTVIAASPVLAAESQRPNVILIMADDFGYEAVTANGGESYETPNLDAMAADGMRFEHCYVQPVCTPTRVELMTGMSNVRNYVQFGVLDRDARTFAHLFKDAGYVTGIAGKWQLGREKDAPRHFGFDEAYLWQHTRRPKRYANPGLEHNGEPRDFNNGEYGPDLIQDFALDFIGRHKAEPFFLYYPMMLTHDPFVPTPDSPEYDAHVKIEKGRGDDKFFADMTKYMDKQVGQLLARLDDLQLSENTLVIFLGDNGTGHGKVSQFKGKEYLGGKGMNTARGMRVPLIVKWSGHVASGKVSDQLVGSVDFLPTICEAAGIKVPTDRPIDGVSFLPQLLGKPSNPDKVRYCWYHPAGGGVARSEFAMTNEYKLYRDGRFFDLTNDILETRSIPVEQLTPEQKEVADRLKEVITSYADARPPKLRGPAPEPLNKNKAKKPQKVGRDKAKRQGKKAKARNQAKAA